MSLNSGDVLVVAQKIVSKAEGCYAKLADVEVSGAASKLAAEADKDPRVVELILRESSAVLRVRPGVIVVEHRNGYVHANAGIDRSNLPQEDGEERVLLLPRDANASAAQLRDELAARRGVELGVVISDSAGRAWRNGTIGMALGSAGVCVLDNRNGEPDLYGRELQATEMAVADELASAAALLMGEAAEALPAIIVRGGDFLDASQTADALLRDRDRDMFR